MKNQVFSCKQKISEEEARGDGVHVSQTSAGSQLIFPLSPCFFVACADPRRWLRGGESVRLPAPVPLLLGSLRVEAGSPRPAQPKVQEGRHMSLFSVGRCGRRALRVMLTRRWVHVRHKCGI